MIRSKKDEDFLKDLVKRPESEILDFKQGITNPAKLAKTLVAFANTKGGMLAIGISDKRKIIGIDENEEQFMLEQAAQNFCFPPVTYELELYETDSIDCEDTTEEKLVLVVKINKSDFKHYYKGESGELIYYIREADRSIPKI